MHISKLQRLDAEVCPVFEELEQVATGLLKSLNHFAFNLLKEPLQNPVFLRKALAPHKVIKYTSIPYAVLLHFNGGYIFT